MPDGAGGFVPFTQSRVGPDGSLRSYDPSIDGVMLPDARIAFPSPLPGQVQPEPEANGLPWPSEPGIGDAARAGPVSDALNPSGAGRGQGGERRKAGMSYGFDITSAYPSIQYVLAAMAIPIEWELKKDESVGKVKR